MVEFTLIELLVFVVFVATFSGIVGYGIKTNQNFKK